MTDSCSGVLAEHHCDCGLICVITSDTVTDLMFFCCQAAHPRPGDPYPARTLTCWIWNADNGPDYPSGSVMADLMKRAFDAGVLFTVTGSQVSWHGAVFLHGIW